MALLFAREGANVAIVHLPEESSDAEETQAAVEETGQQCLTIAGDVTDPGFCEEAVRQTTSALGGLDILVNNAAYQQHQEDISSISLEQWDHTFRTNIYGYFYMARAALEVIRAAARSSTPDRSPGSREARKLLDYASTKGAIHAFTKSLAQNLVPRGIRVNCVAPGPVWTPLNVVDKPAEEAAKHGSKVPMKRPAQPDEIAPAFVFLASEADSSYITGEVLPVLGERRLGHSRQSAEISRQ